MTSGSGLVRQNVAILISETSRQHYVQDARSRKGLYRFWGASGPAAWLKGDQAYLAPHGLAALLRRCCIKFDFLSEDECARPDVLDQYDTVFAANAAHLADAAVAALCPWVGGDRRLVVSGPTNLDPGLLGLTSYGCRTAEGYLGLGWAGEPYLTGPPGYRTGVCAASLRARAVAPAFEYPADISPARTAPARPCGEAVVATANTLYFAHPVFEYFGGLLNGQLDLGPVLAWGFRHKYLDRLGWVLAEILKGNGLRRLWDVRLKPFGAARGAVVLRHDVDGSDDTTYLDYEARHGIPATYAVLVDANRETWLRAVAAVPHLEAAFHFETQHASDPARPAPRKVSRRGLNRQFAAAAGRYRIPAATGHRHYCHFLYPETIDAARFLYDRRKDLLGLGTRFRCTTYRYGCRRPGAPQAPALPHPETQVPFWFPFRLVWSTTSGTEALRGWDVTSAIEPDPETTDAILCQDGFLDHGVYTLGFHPAHCHGKSFRPQGNWEWFLHAIERARLEGYHLATCQWIYEAMHSHESVKVRRDGNRVTVFNPAHSSAADLFLECRHFSQVPESGRGPGTRKRTQGIPFSLVPQEYATFVMAERGVYFTDCGNYR